MDNKQKTVQELSLDQLENVNGGSGVIWLSDQPIQSSDENIINCPFCGKPFTRYQRRDRDHHMTFDCPNRPPDIKVIG